MSREATDETGGMPYLLAYPDMAVNTASRKRAFAHVDSESDGACSSGPTSPSSSYLYGPEATSLLRISREMSECVQALQHTQADHTASAAYTRVPVHSIFSISRDSAISMGDAEASSSRRSSSLGTSSSNSSSPSLSYEGLEGMSGMALDTKLCHYARYVTERTRVCARELIIGLQYLNRVATALERAAESGKVSQVCVLVYVCACVRVLARAGICIVALFPCFCSSLPLSPPLPRVRVRWLTARVYFLAGCVQFRCHKRNSGCPTCAS